MSSHLLLILLLSLSIQTCHGRHLSLGVDGSSRLSHDDSSKDVAKVDEAPNTVKPTQSLLEGEQLHEREVVDGGMVHDIGHGATAEKPKGSKAPSRDVDGARGMKSGVVRIESRVTVSWRLPRQKHREHPGFNVDYDEPTTHPPSHN